MKSRGEFIANMSHELRTPLNGIIGFAELLIDQKAGPLNAEQGEYLRDILDSGRRLLYLINDALDLASIEGGKMELRAENFSVKKAVEEVQAMLGPVSRKKNIKMEMRVRSGVDVVRLDPAKFKQALYNLLSNAVKFTGENGKVTVNAAPLDDLQWGLTVADNGAGIRKKDLGKLFSEFYQIESGAGRESEGAGLGLALTKKLIELQKGRISVESEFGKGSAFTVVLPRDVQARA